MKLNSYWRPARIPLTNVYHVHYYITRMFNFTEQTAFHTNITCYIYLKSVSGPKPPERVRGGAPQAPDTLIPSRTDPAILYRQTLLNPNHSRLLRQFSHLLETCKNLFFHTVSPIAFPPAQVQGKETDSRHGKTLAFGLHRVWVINLASDWSEEQWCEGMQTRRDSMQWWETKNSLTWYDTQSEVQEDRQTNRAQHNSP